jgi:hypothetical protein
MTISADDDNYRPGSFDCHEALHLAYVFADVVDRHLCEHPAIVRNPQWQKVANDAAAALAVLHQLIGATVGDGDPAEGDPR